MSLLMLKTKNLSWQDHTMNIEVMLAPLRSTLLMNKHKTLETKFDKEKALYERQKDACLKDFVVESRLIERRRNKLSKRKKELQAEKRAKSALDEVEEEEEAAAKKAYERSNSAPGKRHFEHDKSHQHPGLPRLTLKHTPLFGGTPLRPRGFLETGQVAEKPSKSRSSTGGPYFYDSDRKSTPVSTPRKPSVPSVNDFEEDNPRDVSRRLPGVTFLDFLDQEDFDEESNIIIEVKAKTVEEKVREFLRDMDAFNSRPPTACSSAGERTEDSVTSGRYTRMSDRSNQNSRYSTFQHDRKMLEKAFDSYCEKNSHEDLFKAMKLAAKMRAQMRQARQASLPTMQAYKSSRSFMKLLKRQQRRDTA